MVQLIKIFVCLKLYYDNIRFSSVSDVINMRAFKRDFCKGYGHLFFLHQKDFVCLENETNKQKICVLLNGKRKVCLFFVFFSLPLAIFIQSLFSIQNYTGSCFSIFVYPTASYVREHF